LRFDPALAPLEPTAELFSLLGMSGRLERAFGGHLRFVSLVAVLYGLLHAASVWTELSYEFDRFASLTWALSIVVAASVTTTVALALYRDASLTHRQKTSGLRWSLAIAFGGLGVTTAVAWWVLPDSPTVQATFQTRSAAGGFLKNELLYFIALLLFVLPTFHAVVRLQGELRAGRVKPVLDLLSGEPEGLAPSDVWFVPFWLLVGVLLMAVAIGYHGINNMLDHLLPGPYANLFTAALHVRVALWYVVALTCMAWYQRSLNELKREAIAASRLLGRTPKA
jgi:hypothetical protein